MPDSARGLVRVGVAATFYLAAFYLRTSPAVMTTELMRDFGISASQLGQFSAFYFYAYILMQIPDGRAGRFVGRAPAADRRLSCGGGRHVALRRDQQLRAGLGRPRDRRRGDGRRLGRHVEARDALVSEAPLRDAVRPRPDDGQHRRAVRASAAAAAGRALSAGEPSRSDRRRACSRSAPRHGRSSSTIRRTRNTRATRRRNCSATQSSDGRPADSRRSRPSSRFATPG